MKIGKITVAALAAFSLMAAAAVFMPKEDAAAKAEKELRDSFTLLTNKKMYEDAAKKYKEIIKLDRSNYNNIIEYRDYCKEHNLSDEAAWACLEAVKLKESGGETDFESAQMYLQWLEETESRDIYSFLNQHTDKFADEERQYLSDYYDSIKGNYRVLTSGYSEIGGWHSNYVYYPWGQQRTAFFGDEMYAFAKETENIVVLSSEAKVLAEAPEIVSYSMNKNLIAAHDEEQLVYVNTSSQRKIVPYDENANVLLNFGYLGPYWKNIANFEYDGKWGYINDNAQYCSGAYEQTSPFMNGIAAVKSEGKWQFVTYSSKDGITAVSDEKYDDIYFDEYGYPFSYGFAYVKKLGSEKWSLVSVVIDEETSSVTGVQNIGEQEFEEVSPFLVNGAVKSGGKWGFIKPDGTWLIEPQFDCARSMSCGLAPVQVGTLWGYVNPEGKMIITPQFDDAGAFNIYGCAAVNENGDWKIIRQLEYEYKS